MLEIVDDPVPFMSEIRRVLTPGGHIVVLTPNANAYYSVLLRILGRQINFGHLRRLTMESLCLLAEASGFSLVRSKTGGAYLSPSIFGPWGMYLVVQAIKSAEK